MSTCLEWNGLQRVRARFAAVDWLLALASFGDGAPSSSCSAEKHTRKLTSPIMFDSSLERLRRSLAAANRDLRSAVNNEKSDRAVVAKAAAYRERLANYRSFLAESCLPPAVLSKLALCEACENHCPGIVECLRASAGI